MSVGDHDLATIKNHLLKSAEIKTRTIEACSEDVVKAADLVEAAFRNGNKLMICGNGGSAADAQHMAAEFTSRLSKDFERPSLPALALTTDTSFLTAFANDCGYEGVFARQVEGLGKKGDVFLGITTSGGSKNVMKAVTQCREMGISVIALTGEAGIKGESAEVVIAIPSSNTQFIQESHLCVEHLICEIVERRLFG